MAQPPAQPSTYKQGYSDYTLATHQRRTADADGAFLVPHLKKTDHLLDVGCGPGTITTGFAKYVSEGRVVGLDISTKVLDKAKALAAEAGIPAEGPGSVTFTHGNVLERLPFPDASFDAVFCSQVFGHIPGRDLPLRAMAEIRRVLKPGGVLASRDAAFQHFYPRSFDLDRLWVGNMKRVIQKQAGGDADGTGESAGAGMPALFRAAGFDADGGKVQLGARAQVNWGPEALGRLAWRGAGQLSKGDPFYQSWLDAGISEAEIQETLQAVEKWAATEDAWFATLQFETLGWK